MGRLLESLRSAELTYPAVGATLAGSRPAGFRYDHHGIALGFGDVTFERGVRGLKGWRAHGAPGIRVFPDDAEICPGQTVVVSLGLPFLALAAPCRIVEVIDEPDRWGFAYGTMPGHPEEGEEAFCVSRAGDGSVRFDITSLSRPGHLLVRLSGPIARGLQTMGAMSYLRALRRYVERAA